MDSTRDQHTEGLAVIHVLATVLDRLCIANAAMAQADPGQVTKFHAMKAPGIGILQYLERIHKYASCSNECFILALIYIDRLIQRNNFLLTELNVHRVVITGILLAAKFFDDAYYNNAYYAKVGGVLVSEMNGLEVDFLFRINFSLHVTPEVFEKYRVELLSQAASCGFGPQATAEGLVQATTSLAVAPSPSHQPTPSPAVYSPHNMMCNHQGAEVNSVPPGSEQPDSNTACGNPFMKTQPYSQITPPSTGPSQLAFVQRNSDSCNNYSEDSLVPVYTQIPDGFAQLQRSLSCPAPDGGIYSHCGVAAVDPPCSEPVIITPGVGVHYPIATPSVDHANLVAMMEQQIFPLQNTLVHHNRHGHHHHSAYSIQPNPDSRGRTAMVATTGGAV